MLYPLASFAKSIATVCLSGTLPDKLEAAALAGFQGVEIFENDLLTYDGSPGESAASPTSAWPSPSTSPSATSRRCRSPSAAATSTAPSANSTPCRRWAPTSSWSAATPSLPHPEPERAADLREMAERAAARGLRVGFEALAWGRQTSLWRQAWDIVRQADHPALGLILDSFHTLSRGDDPPGSTPCRPRGLLLQLADAPKLSMDVLSWSRHFRIFPGQGELPVGPFLRDVLRAAIAARFAGDLQRRIPRRPGPPHRPRRIAQPDPVDEARGGPARQALPEPPAFAGFEFLEFAVDEQAGEQLAGLLGTLGFQHAGLHRSKSVELQRQGGVNLVLNSEPDSAASERFEMFGPTVCAMALRVDTRPAPWPARNPCSPRLAGTDRRGRAAPIPAIRAPDGTLISILVQPGRIRSHRSGKAHSPRFPGTGGERTDPH